MHINRILLSRMKYIGDVVLTTPVIRAVREKFPEAYIAYLGDKKAVSLLEHNPHLNEIIAFDYSRMTIFEQPRVISVLRKRAFDVAVDMFSNPRSALLTFASGAAMRIGKEHKTRGRFYTHQIPDYGSLAPAIDYHYQYVKPLGVEMQNRKTEIFLTEEEKREAKIFLEWQEVDTSRPIVAMHPGATWPNKEWLKEHFVELANKLKSELRVEILLSPGPEDTQLLDSILSNRKVNIHRLPVLPVRQLAAILSQCAVFVSNDCGPMHIGVAVGTPTLGIFGPEPTEVWFPYSEADGHKAFFKKIECSPCRTTKCFREPEHYMDCMKLITVDEVFTEVKKRVERGGMH